MAILGVKRECVIGHKRRYPGEAVSVADGEAGMLLGQYPQALARIDVPKAASTPAAVALAEKAGVDLSQVKGSGKGGLIIKRDVEYYLVDLPVLPDDDLEALDGSDAG